VNQRPPLPPVQQGRRAEEGAGRRGCLEHQGPGAGIAGLQPRTPVWRNRDQFVTGRTEIAAFLTRSGSGNWTNALRKELVVPRREPHRCAFPVRVPRFGRAVVPQLRQRAVGVRRERPDAPPGGQHQRPADRRGDRRIFGTRRGKRVRPGDPAAVETPALLCAPMRNGPRRVPAPAGEGCQLSPGPALTVLIRSCAPPGLPGTTGALHRTNTEAVSAGGYTRSPRIGVGRQAASG